MIDLRVYGSPPQCRETAAALRRWAESFTEASHDLRRALRTSERGWHGDAGEAFRATAGALGADAADAGSDVRRVADALDTFAGALESVQQTMRMVEVQARRAGLLVERSVVHPPVPSADGSPVVHSARVVAYDRVWSDSQEAREIERAAHERLQSLVAGLRPSLEVWLEKIGVKPHDHLGLPGVALWGAKLGFTMAGASATWLTMVHHGALRSSGRHAASRAAPHVIGLRAASRGNWQAKAGRSVAHARWAQVGTLSSRAGPWLSAGTSALDQWEEDSDRRDLSSGERYVRAGAQGGMTGLGAGAGAWAGAKAGIAVGAAVGTVFPGVGTAVGGAVGGVVGGIAGGVAGSTVGDQIGDWLADQATQDEGDEGVSRTEPVSGGR